MTSDARAILMAMRDGLYRMADGLGVFLDVLDERDEEIRRLKVQNREMCKLMDEQVAPVEYEKKEVN